MLNPPPRGGQREALLFGEFRRAEVHVVYLRPLAHPSGVEPGVERYAAVKIRKLG